MRDEYEHRQFEGEALCRCSDYYRIAAGGPEAVTCPRCRDLAGEIPPSEPGPHPDLYMVARDDYDGGSILCILLDAERARTKPTHDPSRSAHIRVTRWVWGGTAYRVDPDYDGIHPDRQRALDEERQRIREEHAARRREAVADPAPPDDDEEAI